jgi:hypothetical protein
MSNLKIVEKDVTDQYQQVTNAEQLAAVTIYQSKHGSKYKKANLEAVQQYQDREGQQYCESHNVATKNIKKHMVKLISTQMLFLYLSINRDRVRCMLRYIKKQQITTVSERGMK